MRQQDIKVGAEYVIATTNTYELPGNLQRGSKGALHATIVATNVEYSQGRRDGVTIDFSGNPLLLPGDETQATVHTRKVVQAVADIERREQERQAAKAEEDEQDRQRSIEVGQQLDAEHIGRTVQSLMYRPAEPAVDLLDALDNLMEQAAKLKTEIEKGIEFPKDRPGKWHAQPKRNKDGNERLVSVRNDLGWLTNAYGKVVTAVADYEGHTRLLNALSFAGVDFERSVKIVHPKS